MKTTEQISVGGYAFTLEQDASQALGKYISELEAHYLQQEGGKEIMEGIEERVAELLLDKCGNGRVGTLAHVQAVIDVVGRPERIEADDPAMEDTTGQKQQKRLAQSVKSQAPMPGIPLLPPLFCFQTSL